MTIIKLKEKITKLTLIGFACLSISPALFAYDELIEKKYKTFDGRIFGIKENAILHEKVQKKVDVLMNAFKKDIEEFEQQKTENKGWERSCLEELRLKKNLYEEYDGCLYKCIKKLEEKGIDVEIKLTQICGTFTTYRSSNSK